MSLTIEEVTHIAKLARLSLSPDELEKYRGQLSAILDYASSLKELDTSSIPPTSSVLPPRSVLRQDEPSQGLDLPALLKNAPRTDQSQFRVPPVLE
jgi:aspartyl-tRNA(Asn)/glutamyl-tRNA(Gln) amidotransferase subunit C